jgi:predicted transcriptional regulator
MTANIDYLGMRAMLRSLTKRGVITPKEEEKIAARIVVTTGADLIVFQ